ncbi:hypothetical protein WUBG_05160 [Wuchereria bancrofti]|uniref:Lipid-binding serum glycoprotein C-terminal domain-containing protein n=1 Tax=Wuchereria bancrofti TaxID=6293 RepID=J9EP06_WUCBA|nr:hypothetical protein WUBG_05160 [Wuchereria bancrofti]
MDTLINFGICLGDIAPGIREKNPGKRTYIILKTNRAPSVQFQSANKAQLIANRIVAKVQIERMEFIDVDKTFGLPSEAFTNLSDLARGILTRAINKRLANGIPLTMPQLGLPIQFQNIHFQVIEHALFISTDVNIPSLTHYLPYQRFAGCPYYYQIS